MDDLSRSEYPAMLVSLGGTLKSLCSRHSIDHWRFVSSPGKFAAESSRPGTIGQGQAHLQSQPGNRRLAAGTKLGRPDSQVAELNMRAGTEKSRRPVCQWLAEVARLQGPQHSLGARVRLASPFVSSWHSLIPCLSQCLPNTMGQDPPVDRCHRGLPPTIRAAHREGRRGIPPRFPEQARDAKHADHQLEPRYNGKGTGRCRGKGG